MFTLPSRRLLGSIVPAAAVAAALLLGEHQAAGRAQGKKDVVVAAYKYGYRVNGDGPEIRVQQDDLVRITFSTEDIPHSFTIEDETYRVMRRAEAGKPVTFEFRADKPGRFVFQCTLKADERCKEMRGVLIVEPRRQPK